MNFDNISTRITLIALITLFIIQVVVLEHTSKFFIECCEPRILFDNSFGQELVHICFALVKPICEVVRELNQANIFFWLGGWFVLGYMSFKLSHLQVKRACISFSVSTLLSGFLNFISVYYTMKVGQIIMTVK